MNIKNNNYCCGCTACEKVCPTKAIKMQPDREGFIRAVVDEDKCIHCEKCCTVCPELHSSSVVENTRISYAAISRDEEIVDKSSSGGVFSCLAQGILKQNGVVYGCAMENNEAVHVRITEYEEIDSLRRSKYIQSNLRDVFTSVKQDLQQKKVVLFSGTPCQVAGLRLFLEQKYDNLYCVDLICHGVPSPKMFKENIIRWEEKLQGKVLKYEFRLKQDFKTYAFFFNIFLKEWWGGVYSI